MLFFILWFEAMLSYQFFYQAWHFKIN